MDGLDAIKRGFSIAMVLLIIYLSIFGLNLTLSIIWLFSIPFNFVMLMTYDFLKEDDLFPRGLSTDIYLSISGPVSIIGFFASLYFIVKERIYEEHEESFTEEGDGDTRHDEHTNVLQKQEDEKSSKSEKSKKIKKA